MTWKVQNIVLGTSVVILVVAITFCFLFQKQERKREIIPENLAVNYWNMFAGITQERRFIEEADARVPIFTSVLQAHSGQEVTLTGNYLPYSKLDSAIIISRFPIANCFFCGKAGIESVAMVELEHASKHTYRTDQRLTVRGKLMLNSTNIKKLAFVITDASVERHQTKAGK